MKLIKAFIHHVRCADVVQSLGDAGYRNITLQDVRGMLKPITRIRDHLLGGRRGIGDLRGPFVPGR